MKRKKKLRKAAAEIRRAMKYAKGALWMNETERQTNLAYGHGMSKALCVLRDYFGDEIDGR